MQFVEHVSGASGTTPRDMNVDGSSVPAVFEWQPERPANIHRINMHIADAGMSSYDEFAGLGSPLTNGIKMQIVDETDVVLLDFFDGYTWARNSDIFALAGMDSQPDTDAGTDSNPIRFTLSKSGEPVEFGLGIRLRYTIQDDLRNVDELTSFVQGEYLY